MTLEQYTKDALDFCAAHIHDDAKYEHCRQLILKYAEESYICGYSPSQLGRSIIDHYELTDYKGNILRCPVCGKVLTTENSIKREEFSKYADGMDYTPRKMTYHYKISSFSCLVCCSCNSKLNTRRKHLRRFVLFLSIGVPIGLFFGGGLIARAISRIPHMEWLAIIILGICLIAALVFPWVALFGDSFTEWLGKLLKPIFGPYRVEKED